MNSLFTYLAAPYSDSEPKVIESRMELVLKADAYLTAVKHKMVVTPLSKHFILPYRQIPNDWNFWQNYSRSLLNVCFEMYVLTLPGWKESSGVAGEIDHAKTFDIPIYYLNPDEFK